MVQIQDGREARDMVRLTFLLLQLEQKFWWLGYGFPGWEVERKKIFNNPRPLIYL